MEKFLNTDKAVEYLKTKYGIELKPSTLVVWRSQGKGPEYRRAFGKVFYTTEDLDAFVEKRLSKRR